ncbi:unnamed protein product [Kluyveromyces dobzhanskii CBS 2104]|uniref:chitinase n=1 Tax=Kluyveromyces dobzhanskii CBS 2104 TaxID=1427455 RepID=A0A0A8L1F7_9SACH|nr:unnamed protein product [Kluyveromyces dobzhanskii CBS 2104]
MFQPSLLLLSLLQLLLVSAFDINGKDNVAVYWGQASAGSQESLGTYCASENVDIVVLSFLYEFPDNLAINFASACTTTFESGLLHCPSIAADIETCQSNGKKVFLSLGGAVGSYGFTDDSQAEEFATTLWNTFGEGYDDSVERPFDGAVVDGFDFDIENNDSTGYAALATKLRTLYATGSKDYYLAAAPQCVYPDASVGDALANADIDFAFVQFYNNYCNVDKQFNWDTWTDFADNTSPNKDIKLYLGLPASASAAGSGYISDLSLLESTVKTIGQNSHFGGIMLWDASQAFTNEVEGETYVAQMKSILEDNTDSTSSSASTTSAASSTSTTSSSTTTSTSSTFTTSSTSSTTTSTSSTSTSTTSSASTSEPAVATTTSSISSDKATTSISTTVSAVTSALATSSAEPTTTETSTHFTTTLQPITSSSDVSTALPTSAAPETSTTANPTTTLQPTTTQSTDSAQSTDSWAVTRAKELNQQYGNGELNGKDSCFDGEIACSADGKIAICNYGAWVYTECAAGTTCFAYATQDTVNTSCNFSSLKSESVF